MQLVKNFLYLTGAEMVSKVVTFVAIAYLARVVGPVSFGYIEFVTAVILCAGLIIDQGFGLFGAREIAKAPEHTGKIVSEIVLLRFVLAIGVYAAVIVFALLFDCPPIVTRLLFIYALSLLAMPLLLQWVFQGHDRMEMVATIQLVRQIVFASVVCLFVRDESLLWFVAVAEVVGVGCAAIYGLWMYRRCFGGRIRLRIPLSTRAFREGLPIGLSQMFWMVRMFGATLILGFVASAQDVGFFASALRIFIALHTFVWLYFFNLLPSFSRMWQQGYDALARLVDQSFHWVAWISSIVAAVWISVAPAVIIKVYGPAFGSAGGTLQWLAGVCLIAGLSGHYRFALIAAGQQKYEMVISAVGALVAVILIPIGYIKAGPNGAAMALFVAEITVWFASSWFARQRLRLVPSNHLILLLRPLLAVVLTLAWLYMLPLGSNLVHAAAFVLSVSGWALVLDAAVRDRFRYLRMTSYKSWVRYRNQRSHASF